jgi:uncharacterized protein YxeA
MKKIFVVLCCTLLFCTITFASKPSNPKKRSKPLTESQSEKKGKLDDKASTSKGRECCTQEAYDSNGNLVSVTSCAGWFLSNSENAYNRACDKALAGLSAIINNP